MYPWIRLAPRMDRLAAASDRIDALMSLTQQARCRKSNYEGNAALSAPRFIGAFLNDRILGRPGTLCLAPIAAEQ